MLAKVGQKAPDFTMSTTENIDTLDHIVTLDDYTGKWLILFFYPLDFTFVCPTEIRGLNTRIDELKGLGAQVLGVSIDSVYSHRAWIKASKEEGGLGDLNYPLASDITKQVAQSYGVLILESWRKNPLIVQILSIKKFT